MPFFSSSHSPSADGIPFDCSVAIEFPVTVTESCQEYIVNRLPALSGPGMIKATACPIETSNPENKTVFIYTHSPGWPVWLCRNKKEWEDLQKPEAPTLTVTIVDNQADAPDDEIPAVSGGGYGDDFFDDSWPRKPGMPAAVPFILETVSGWLPARLMSSAFGLELPGLPDNVPVLFRQAVMSNDSGILVIISGTRQRIYRRGDQLGDWYLAGQTESEALSPTEAQFDDFIAENKLERALVGVFGWAGKDSIPIYQMPIGRPGASAGVSGGSESTSGSGAPSSRHSATGGSTGPLQRQHQGQGFGGGGERNPTLIELMDQQPSLLRQFLTEALKLFDELNDEEKLLSFIHLLANIYLDDERIGEIYVSSLKNIFRNTPKIAVYWLTVVARLFPDTPRLNSGFLSGYKEVLLNLTFPKIFNESATRARSIDRRFYLLKHCSISNQFVLELCHRDSLLAEKLNDSLLFQQKEAQWRKIKNPHEVWPFFVDLFKGNDFWRAFEEREVQDLNGWLAILSKVLQELHDTGQENFVNLMLVGLGPEDRETVLSQMKSMAQSDVEMALAQSVDWKQVAQRAIKQKSQLEAQLNAVQSKLPRTIDLAEEAKAQLRCLTTEKQELQQIVRALLEERQSFQTSENINPTISMATKTELSQASSEELTTCLLELQSKLKATQKELRETEVKMMCAICQGTYTEPYLLPCHHMFCKECIRQLTTDQSQRSKCPRCSKPFSKEAISPVYP